MRAVDFSSACRGRARCRVRVRVAFFVEHSAAAAAGGPLWLRQALPPLRLPPETVVSADPDDRRPPACVCIGSRSRRRRPSPLPFAAARHERGRSAYPPPARAPLRACPWPAYLWGPTVAARSRRATARGPRASLACFGSARSSFRPPCLRLRLRLPARTHACTYLPAACGDARPGRVGALPAACLSWPLALAVCGYGVAHRATTAHPSKARAIHRSTDGCGRPSWGPQAYVYLPVLRRVVGQLAQAQAADREPRAPALLASLLPPINEQRYPARRPPGHVSRRLVVVVGRAKLNCSWQILSLDNT